MRPCPEEARHEQPVRSTHVRQGGQVLAHARRTLSADGQRMTVTQSGPAPGGGTFANVSVDVREAGG